MRPTQTICLWLNQVAYGFVVPALRNVRVERGTHSLTATSKIKSLGHSRPAGENAGLRDDRSLRRWLGRRGCGGGARLRGRGRRGRGGGLFCRGKRGWFGRGCRPEE